MFLQMQGLFRSVQCLVDINNNNQHTVSVLIVKNLLAKLLSLEK